MARYRFLNGEKIELTSEEEAARDERLKLWEAESPSINLLREQRNLLLSKTDWIVIIEREEGGSVSNFTDWKKYRQELRDITKTYKSLDDVKWPEEPSS